MKRNWFLCNYGIESEPYPGFDWYVDSVNGLDTNAGTSSTAPLQTIAALEAKTIQASDKIGLAKGSHWREQLDITADTVTVEAYGASGAAPIFDASDIIPAGSWSKTGEQTNVYQASVNADIAAAKTWVNAWENNAFLTRAADLATCDATPGSYLPSADTGAGGPITVYIHPTGSTNPTSDGKIYEVTVRQYGLNARAATGSIITGIETRRNLHEDGSAIFGRSSVVANCTFSDGSKHNTLCNDGSLLVDCVAAKAYYGTSPSTLYVFNEATPAGLGVTFRRCTATMPIFNAKVAGFFGHKNTSGNFGVVTYDDCIAERVTTGFYGNDATSMVISGCEARDCLYSCSLTQNTTITNLLAYSTIAAHRCVDLPAAITVTIDGLKFCSQNTTTGAAIYSTVVVNLTMTNCQFAATGVANRSVIRLGNSSSVLNSNNNQFGTGWTWIYNHASGAVPTITSDLNCFLSQNFNNGGTTYNTLALWQAGTGQDALSAGSGCDVSAAPCSS